MTQSLRMTPEQLKTYLSKSKGKSSTTKKYYNNEILMESSTKGKYKSTITYTDNVRFASKLEAQYYSYLKMLKNSNSIKYFLRQVPIHLTGGIKYVCDFMVVYQDNRIEYVDTKGFETAIFKLKKKQVEALYPFKIKLVKKASMNKGYDGTSADFIIFDDI